MNIIVENIGEWCYLLHNKICVLLLLLTTNTYAQVPIGYYDSGNGLKGNLLKEALHEIIKDHDEQSYGDLHTHYQKTDKKDDGTVWDMYSDIPDSFPAYSYQFINDKCGSYSQEGDCYNREHSFPANWFNDATPMYSDMFVVIPSDGYVNGKRSNYPYGETDNPIWISTNGSKLGPCSFPGYSGTVFEPIDEYKGDLARGYFYMITRYMDEASGWNSDMLDSNEFSYWAFELLKRWSILDSVSQKEKSRNDSIYLIQNNRNPYIDHPEWTTEIWGDTNELSNIREITYSLDIKITGNTIVVNNPEPDKTNILIYDLKGMLIRKIAIPYGFSQYRINLKSGMYIMAAYHNSSYKVSRFIIVQ